MNIKKNLMALTSLFLVAFTAKQECVYVYQSGDCTVVLTQAWDDNGSYSGWRRQAYCDDMEDYSVGDGRFPRLNAARYNSGYSPSCA